MSYPKKLMSNFPDFIVIGAMKCATSTLHEQLALQPGIFMSQLKEPNFFSNDEQYARGMDWYLSLFAAASPADLCGESSTHYTKLPTYPQTLDRLKQDCPQGKFIYIMRHPIERLISQYIHEWSQRAIAVEIDQAIAQHPELIQYSLYSQQIQPYFQAFGQDRLLPVFFERLLQSPQAELERVCHFIGYQGKPLWHDQLNAQNISSERLRKSAWRDFLLDVPVLREIRQQLIPQDWRDWTKKLWTMKRKPELAPQQRESLQAIFDEDLALLGSWLGIQLDCDNFKATVKTRSYDWV